VGTKVDLIGDSYGAREREVSEVKARAMARRLNAVAWMETSSKEDVQSGAQPSPLALLRCLTQGRAVNELFERMLRESLEWADPLRLRVPVREEPSRWFVPTSLSTTLDHNDDGGGGGQSRSCVLQ
jgi:hypothetical protein